MTTSPPRPRPPPEATSRHPWSCGEAEACPDHRPGDVPEFAEHRTRTEGQTMTAMTAADLVTFLATLNPHQLRTVRDAIDTRIATLGDAQLMREIVGDNRTNPNTTALPRSDTERNAHAMAIFDHIQEQKAAERAAAAEERARGNGSAH
jgi:hypothetical protein